MNKLMNRVFRWLSTAVFFGVVLCGLLAWGDNYTHGQTSLGDANSAQAPTPTPSLPGQPSQTPEKAAPQGQRQEGPSQEAGEAAIKGPKKKKKLEEPSPKEKISQKPGEVAHFTLNVNVVRLDVVATDGRGTPIPGLSEKNFKVYEDKVEQQISNFQPTEAPLTAVLLMEFSRATCGLMYQICSYRLVSDAHVLANMFFEGLRPEDWVAVVAYDMKPEILADFTQEKRNLLEALRRMQIPSWTEANLFDALEDTINRLDEVDGKKSIILFTTGLDTFSKITYDKVLKKVQNADISIYPVSFGGSERIINDDRMGAVSRLNFLQADNELNTFAKMTGGKAYFPRFEGEWPTIIQDIMANLRSQYSIGYTPSNQVRDGKFHKVRVDLVAENGGPLVVHDQHGKNVKVELRYRPGYFAPKD
jgi:VWFA-related protein